MLSFWTKKFSRNIHNSMSLISSSYSVCLSLSLSVCVCVCACVCVCVCVCTSIHREGLICLDQLDYQGTDRRCCAEDVIFLFQISSSLL